MPIFEDAQKAKAWQKLTDLQQHMLGLITAVEGQLKLSDSPKSAREHPAAAVAEQIASAIHHGHLPVSTHEGKASHTSAAAAAAAAEQDDKQIVESGEDTQVQTGD